MKPVNLDLIKQLLKAAKDKKPIKLLDLLRWDKSYSKDNQKTINTP